MSCPSITVILSGRGSAASARLPASFPSGRPDSALVTDAALPDKNAAQNKAVQRKTKRQSQPLAGLRRRFQPTHTSDARILARKGPKAKGRSVEILRAHNSHSHSWSTHGESRTLAGTLGFPTVLRGPTLHAKSFLEALRSGNSLLSLPLLLVTGSSKKRLLIRRCSIAQLR